MIANTRLYCCICKFWYEMKSGRNGLIIALLISIFLQRMGKCNTLTPKNLSVNKSYFDAFILKEYLKKMIVCISAKYQRRKTFCSLSMFYLKTPYLFLYTFVNVYNDLSKLLVFLLYFHFRQI